MEESKEKGNESPSGSDRTAVAENTNQTAAEDVLEENKHLRMIIKASKVKFEKELEEQRQLFRDEIESLRTRVEDACAQKDLEWKAKYENALEPLRQENDRLKELLLQKEQNTANTILSPRGSILSSMSSALKRRFSNLMASSQAESDLEEVLKEVEESAGNVKCSMVPLEDRIKAAQRKARYEVANLRQYQKCFDWLREETIPGSGAGEEEDEQEVGTREIVEALKGKFSGFSPHELVGKLSSTQLAVYLSILKTELAVQMNMNKALREELEQLKSFRDARQSSVTSSASDSEKMEQSSEEQKQSGSSATGGTAELAKVFELADTSVDEPLSSALRDEHDSSLCSDKTCKECASAMATAALSPDDKTNSESMTNFAVFDTCSSKSASSEKVTKARQDICTKLKPSVSAERTRSTRSKCAACSFVLQNMTQMEQERNTNMEKLHRALEQNQILFQEQKNMRDYIISALHHTAQRCQKELGAVTEVVSESESVVHSLENQHKLFSLELRQKLGELTNMKEQVLREVRCLKEDSYNLLKRNLERMYGFEEDMRELPSTEEDLKDLLSKLYGGFQVAKATADEMKDLAQYQLRELMVRLEAHEQEKERLVELLRACEQSSVEKAEVLQRLNADLARERREKAKLEEKLRTAWSEVGHLRKRGRLTSQDTWAMQDFDESDGFLSHNRSDRTDSKTVTAVSKDTERSFTCSNCQTELNHSADVRICVGCRRVMCIACLHPDATTLEATRATSHEMCQGCRIQGRSPQSPPPTE